MIVKLNLECEEHEALLRYAEALGVTDEDIAYAALHRLMLAAKSTEGEIDKDIVEARDGRRHTLSIWTDPAHPVNLHENRSHVLSTATPWPR